ncbi:formylglycine-generating enzyme family protein [Ramlibacter sp. AW1]|uniref:Formylglycine-generating enzyme family protein n=1 Tax=Ramlibacter aurantiacus TaxID=2801330 RepID=A0A936ZQL9_9BURK|nr:formylglycine-generating enzyme family protein [Ramlibacter aurantiacus]MBL0419220.1 formylglycine-generating enzyme family protein [Ramlibacter aurantiacus]
MQWIEGGAFAMGSARFYPEERPVRVVEVDSFWIDETPVTNASFAAFVQATGYLTAAERTGSSAVFEKTSGPVDRFDPALWWRLREGACWRNPWARGLDGLQEHPVVHVAYEDAQAFAAWAGKRLPTEAEWEYAARGGLAGADYAWGDQLAPDGLVLANYWQGEFPHQNTLLDGWERTSPVRSYPGNGYGLFDMIGNVWEWTSDRWSVGGAAAKPGCCASASPRDGVLEKVIKGGSHLCARNYCQRYRPAARYAQRADLPTSHIGFRCVADRPIDADSGSTDPVL